MDIKDPLFLRVHDKKIKARTRITVYGSFVPKILISGKTHL